MPIPLTIQEALLISKILETIEANIEHLPADLEVLYATQESAIRKIRRNLERSTGY